MVLTSDKWKEPIEFVKFLVTGFYYNTTMKFRSIYGGSQADYHTINSINLWRGRIWGITSEGKRKLIKSVYN